MDQIINTIGITSIETNEKYVIKDDYIVFNREFDKIDSLKFNFKTDDKILIDANGEHYYKYGVLFFAKSIKASKVVTKEYYKGYNDINYKPLENFHYKFYEEGKVKFYNGKVNVELKNERTNTIENVELIPFGKTLLRQVSFLKFGPDLKSMKRNNF